MKRVAPCYFWRQHRVALAALALVGLLSASEARADNLDTWNIFVGTNVTYYSNLFLLPPPPTLSFCSAPPTNQISSPPPR